MHSEPGTLNPELFHGREAQAAFRALIDRLRAVAGDPADLQIMAAVATVKKAKAEGRSITEADLDGIRNVCRCGTYNRILEAIKAGAAAYVLKDIDPTDLIAIIRRVRD